MSKPDKHTLLLFLDTEFTDLDEPRYLISLGLAAETGETFYAELTDGWQLRNCSPFVWKNILPLLEEGADQMDRATAACSLTNWISSFDQPVRIVSDAKEFDWPLLQELLEEHWPDNLLHSCISFHTSFFPIEVSNELELTRQRYFFVQRRMIGRLLEHHALHDARALRRQWQQAERLAPEMIRRMKSWP
ncbi:MAG: 3'-5' exoribonuclease [Geobacteraceae bacterium]|nr:3'-5' exoribonuclease [Geobacteraceae bacterium]